MSIRASEPEQPRFSRLDPGDRRAAILAAARAVVVREGLAGTSTTAVAAEAGVTRGLVHHYFGSKHELFLAVLADLTATLPAAVRTDLDELPLDEVMAVNCRAFLDAFERDREVWRALLGAGRGDPEAAAVVERMRDEMVERMAANQARGARPSDEHRLVLRVFLSAAETAAIEWAQRGRATREQAEALLLGTLRAMVYEVLPALSAAGPSSPSRRP